MNNDFGLSLKAVFKREELKESAKDIMEKFENFLNERNIDVKDKENSAVFLYNEGKKIRDRLYDKSYKTVRDLTKADGNNA